MEFKNRQRFNASVVEFFGLTTTLRFQRALDRILLPKAPKDPSIIITDTAFRGIKVRLYEPKDKQNGGKLPGLIYYHGGGWCTQDVDSLHHVMLHLAKALGAVVLSIEYRLAPEYVFPAGLNDCVTATKHFIQNAERFSVDPARIGVMGDSSGGNLATAVLLKLNDENFKHFLKLQVLIYPSTQLFDLHTPSFIKHGHIDKFRLWYISRYYSNYLAGNESLIDGFMKNEHVLNLGDWLNTYLQNFFEQSELDLSQLGPFPKSVLRGLKASSGYENVLDPYVSPLMASDESLQKLPKTFLMICEFDLVRDEGILYGKRLSEVGVDVQLKYYPSGYHGMLFHSDMVMPHDVEDYLKKNL
ncbi:arylacetamide deacetylase-like [Branchiostoma floridae x Branchiostoma belcheri]